MKKEIEVVDTYFRNKPLYVDCDGILTKIKFVESRYKVNVYSDGIKQEHIFEVVSPKPNPQQIHLDKKFVFYPSLNDYNEGKSVKLFYTLTWDDFIVSQFGLPKEHGEEKCWYIYNEKSGAQKLSSSDIAWATIKPDEVLHCFKNVNVYKSKKECEDNNFLHITDENGFNRKVEGKYRKLILTEEQRKLIGKVWEAIDNAENAGVRFVYDDYDNTLICFNGTHVENYGFEICDSCPNEYIPFSNVKIDTYINLMNINSGDDGYGILVESKNK